MLSEDLGLQEFLEFKVQMKVYKTKQLRGFLRVKNMDKQAAWTYNRNKSRFEI